MVDGFVTDGDKMDFKSIVLAHLKKIMNISLSNIHPEQKFSLYMEGTNTLADVLVPFFDERMNNAYDDFEQKLKQLQDKADKLLEEKKLENQQYGKSDYLSYIFSNKVDIYRKLFRELNLLLNRNDYLKASVYSEGDDTEDIQ